MSVSALKWAYAQDPGGFSAKAVLVALAYRANDEAQAWPSIANLSAMTCLNRKSVQKGLRQIRAAGLAEQTQERKGKSGRVKVWRLLMAQASLTLDRPKQAQNRAHYNGQLIGPNQGWAQNRDSPKSGPINRPKSGPLNQQRESTKQSNDCYADGSAAACAQVFKAWNLIAQTAGLSVAQSLTPARRKRLAPLVEQFGLATVIQAIETVPSFGMLTGNNPSGWKAHFDWLLNERSMARLIEGSFSQGSSASGAHKDEAHFEYLTRMKREGLR